jgi:hypothetical protein
MCAGRARDNDHVLADVLGYDAERTAALKASGMLT